eukprot:1189279-Prorocentrum_minimum.AAC.3
MVRTQPSRGVAADERAERPLSVSRSRGTGGNRPPLEESGEHEPAPPPSSLATTALDHRPQGSRAPSGFLSGGRLEGGARPPARVVNEMDLTKLIEHVCKKCRATQVRVTTGR